MVGDRLRKDLQDFVTSERLGLDEGVYENIDEQAGYEAGKEEILNKIQEILDWGFVMSP